MTARKTTITILVGAVVALTPPSLVYFQGRAELRAKYAHTSAEADAGYQTLVDSVRELRVTVSAQHDAITKMQGYLDALQAFSPAMRMTVRPPPLTKPDFHELPANLDAAQTMKR
jgi:hypothetical protein